MREGKLTRPLRVQRREAEGETKERGRVARSGCARRTRGWRGHGRGVGEQGPEEQMRERTEAGNRKSRKNSEY